MSVVEKFATGVPGFDLISHGGIPRGRSSLIVGRSGTGKTILGLQIVFLSLYLIGVQKWWQALVCIVAIGLMGWLFWKLVRPMARLQMPDRPNR